MECLNFCRSIYYANENKRNIEPDPVISTCSEFTCLGGYTRRNI